MAGPARAQADAQQVPEQDWSEGTWSGDEGSWDADEPNAGEPRDGYAPRDDDWSQPQAQQGEWEQQGSDWSQQASDSDTTDDWSNDTSGPSIDTFRTELSPYGQWLQIPGYGLVWQPSAQPADWRPYAWGQWVWTNRGWMWVSDEPFGWATYHYGRWAFANGYWVWIPGRIWGPAWVSWRNGGGGMGWCALGWRGEVCHGGPGWIFVEHRHFLDPVRTYGIPPGQTRGWYERSHHLPKLRPGKHWGPPIRFVTQVVGHPVRPVPVTKAGTSMGATRSGTYNGGGIHVFVPHTQPFPHPVNRGPGRYETPREWPATEHTRTGPPERPGNEWHPPTGEPKPHGEGNPRIDHGTGEWNRGGEAGQGPGGRPHGGDPGEGHPRGDPGEGRPQNPGGWHAPHESPPQREPRGDHGGNTGVVPPHRVGGEGRPETSGGRPEKPQGKPEKVDPPPKPKVQIEKK